jgi:threonine synthase
MDYYSTNGKNHRATFREAVLTGLAPDGGLWMPSTFPVLPGFRGLTFSEVGRAIVPEFVGTDIPGADLDSIVSDALNFEVPLRQLSEDLFVLELFHGPTLSFKDFGARFLARVLSFFLQGSRRPITVLTATSGDTGGAVAAGFNAVPNVRVFLLYPSQRISSIQEKQITTWGGNVTAVEVGGNFDDCQSMAKQAFQDPELKKVNLTSANSINIGRLLPQSFYYAYASAQMDQCHFAVPCGNLGNLTAGLFAKKMGSKIDRLIAATNTNDVFVEFLKTGVFHARPGHPTISNAMDVGNPSNLARIIALYGSDIARFRQNITGFSFNDQETLDAIREIHRKYAYICDPHTAVGYLALKIARPAGPKILVATAHPAKFPEVVQQASGVAVEIPERLVVCLNKQKQSIQIGNDYAKLKDVLISYC